jgi:hypothetical protein
MLSIIQNDLLALMDVVDEAINNQAPQVPAIHHDGQFALLNQIDGRTSLPANEVKHLTEFFYHSYGCMPLSEALALHYEYVGEATDKEPLTVPVWANGLYVYDGWLLTPEQVSNKLSERHLIWNDTLPLESVIKSMEGFIG